MYTVDDLALSKSSEAHPQEVLDYFILPDFYIEGFDKVVSSDSTVATAETSRNGEHREHGQQRLGKTGTTEIHCD